MLSSVSAQAVLRRVRACLGLSAALLLAACGGGGGGGASSSTATPVAAGTLRVHYQRADANYTGWGVYAWSGPVTPSTGWPGSPRFLFTQNDAYGAYTDIPVSVAAGSLQFLVTQPNAAGTDATKDCATDRTEPFSATLATAGQEIWLKSGDCSIYATLADTQHLNIGQASAMWLNASTVAWPGADASRSFRLYYAASGGIVVDASLGVSGADGAYDLGAGASLSAALAAQYPQLAGAASLTLPAAAQSAAPSLLKGQLVVVEFNGSTPVAATQLQIQGVLDDLYAAAATPQTLGLSFDAHETPTFRLWAPTARSVSLNVNGSSLPMTLDAGSGVWSLTGDPTWTDTAYYTYTVQVWSRADGGTVHSYTVTDPYATSADADVFGGPQQRSMVADLNSAALKPAGWDTQAAPGPVAPADIVLYELHVRDFSDNDPLVPAAHAGKYLAFTDAGTYGQQELQRLAAAGVTHVHLLPVFSFASINEGGCTTPSISNTDPVSTAPQSLVAAGAGQDCYNWGYDPLFYGLPEGAYASDAADGTARVREFRAMVQGLHATGLSVVMDVVYNHTAGDFLDRIVPGYYYRLDGDGNITTASCCQDTAPEFAMMEKLMTDTLVRWARDYRVDGFRFDIMGFIPKAVMLRAQAAVQAAIGSGRSTYFYGEGWNFGPVQNDARFVQARQLNLAGTGIGSFNDRVRDAVRGGGPFDSGAALVSNQGFADGLCYDDNAGTPCSTTERATLQHEQDWIRLSLAGNLAGFVLNGKTGSQIDYNGQPAGYTGAPQEAINYASSHDNQTLYDVSQYRQPAATTSADRARAQVVALGTLLMGQGVPFLQAGDELLRSKGFDQNSYDSGDWFNRIDWSGTTNYIGSMGLPVASQNQSNWATMTPFLQNPAVAPTAADIAATRDAVLDLLRVRRDTTMFRLGSAAAVERCVSFPDQAQQADGLIVMRIGQDGQSCGDNKYKTVMVLINANKVAQTYTVAALAGRTLGLDPLLATGSDPVVKTAAFASASGAFTVPARTVAVFVEH